MKINLKFVVVALLVASTTTAGCTSKNNSKPIAGGDKVENVEQIKLSADVRAEVMDFVYEELKKTGRSQEMIDDAIFRYKGDLVGESFAYAKHLRETGVNKDTIAPDKSLPLDQSNIKSKIVKYVYSQDNLAQN